MSNMYRSASPRHRPPSRAGFIAVRAVIGMLVIGGFVLGVWLFRKGGDTGTEAASIAEAAGENETQVSNETTVSNETQVSIPLTPLAGAAASGTATRTHEYGMFSIVVVAQLPAVDQATTAYEAWFVKPGITDFFSLGQMYPREDGAWGLVWEAADAIVRSDIDEFQRVIIMREPRDGNTGPSADQVLEGNFE